MEIREATDADLDACAELAAAHDGRPADVHRDRLARLIGRPHFLVAVRGGALVGSARVTHFEPGTAPTGWYLIGLVVAADHRCQGIGRALTAARVRWALERADEVFYFTGTANRASYALHASLGFTERTRDFAFPNVPLERGGVLCRLTRETARL